MHNASEELKCLHLDPLSLRSLTKAVTSHAGTGLYYIVHLEAIFKDVVLPPNYQSKRRLGTYSLELERAFDTNMISLGGCSMSLDCFVCLHK